jgi:hypothetical protein
MATKPSEPELTKEEVERRAGELARKVMALPHKRQEWSGRRKAAAKTPKREKPRA